MSSLRNLIEEALEALHLERNAAEPLVRYVQALHAYNRVHRVVGALSESEIAQELIVDALALARLVQSPLVDVGTGAGLPGLVLKMARPELRLTLIEPRSKPSAFVAMMRAELKMQHVKILDQPVEQIQISQLQDGQAASCIVSKGYGPLEKLVHSARHLAASSCSFIVCSSKPDCALPEAHTEPHPLLPDRWIHQVELKIES